MTAEMACSVADGIIAKLRGRKTNAVSYLSLLTPTGDAVSLAKDAIRQCVFFDTLLKNQPSLTEHRTNASRETLLVFSAFIGHSQYPRIENTFEAILFGRDIDCQEFVRYCCEAATRVNTTRDSKVDDIAFVVGALVKYLPTRTFEHYEKLLSAITYRLAAQDKDMIIDKIVDAIDQKRDRSVDPIPLPMFTKMVTVALMKDVQNKPVVVLLHERVWQPFNIFGSNFCPYAEDVANFHVSFGRYVVYERASDSSVLLKILQPNEPAQVLFTDCKFFRSRCNQLHIIRRGENDHPDSVCEWNHTTMSFEEKFSRPHWKLKTAHRKMDGRLAIVLEEGTAIELINSTPVISGENLVDYIEDCRKEIGETNFCIERHRRNGKLYTETLEESAMIHVGYSRIALSEHGNGDGLYVTKHFKSDSSGYSDTSNLHGVVKTFSDVLLI